MATQMEQLLAKEKQIDAGMTATQAEAVPSTPEQQQTAQPAPQQQTTPVAVENPQPQQVQTPVQQPEVQPQAAPQQEQPQPQQAETVDFDKIEDIQQLRDLARQRDQAYHTLQGKYNAEIPRATQEANQLRQQNAFLIDQMRTLQTAPQQQQPQPPAEPKEPTLEELGWSKEDIDALGGEKMVWKVLKTQDALVENRLKDTVQTVEQQVQTQQATAQKNLLSALAPGWETVDVDPGFQAWASQPISPFMPSQTPAAVLQAAWGNGDVQQVANIFNEYRRVSTASQTQDLQGVTSQQPPQQPQFQQTTQPYQLPQSPANIRPTIREQVSVESAGPAMPQQQAGGQRIYTREEIATIQNRIASRSVRGESLDSLEKEVDAAIREGRIRG